MLVQLHHQFKDGSTEVCSQQDIDIYHSQVELKKLIEETKKSHPLPEGAEWMICSEKSKHFVMMAVDPLNPERSVGSER